MSQREVPLPSSDEMAKRLRKTKLSKATVEGLVPFLSRHAGQVMNGTAVVNRLMLVVADYVLTVQLNMQAVWAHADKIIDALIDDSQVKADAHAQLKKIQNNTKP